MHGVGCFWNHHFAGAVCYADDVALIAPSASVLRLMLRACTQFASTLLSSMRPRLSSYRFLILLLGVIPLCSVFVVSGLNIANL